MHLRHLFFLTALFAAVTLSAKDDPTAVLDAAVDRLENSGGVRGQFTITHFEGTKEVGTTHGHLTMKGEKYTLTTPEHITWYDGETQWTWLKSSNEVNVTRPTQAELRKSSPAALLGAYRKGYKLTMKRSKLRGQKVWEITLTAVSPASRPERVVIDIAEDYTPMCLRARNDGNWTRFAIYDYAVKQNFSDGDFRFKQADYPTAEVVDLR